MSTPADSMTPHPAPQRHRVGGAETAFALLGGPLAWFGQLCSGFVLATWPCFPNDHRMRVPLAAYAWTGPALIGLLLGATAVAVAAAWVSWRTYRRTHDEAAGGHEHLLEHGTGRTRFLALWGLLLGVGFALATALTAVAFAVLPRCAG